MKQIRCGFRYEIGTPAPVTAKYAVYYWGYVVYHQTKGAAEKTMDRLPYYQQEDARIERLK